MKKTYWKEIIFLTVIFIIVFGLFLKTVFAGNGMETIKDNNDGKIGDILVHSGTSSGGYDIGTWTDSSFLKGDKGEDGYTPIKDIDYNDGLNGKDGENIKGDKGDNGNNIKGDTGEDGINGLNGKDVDPATVDALKNTDVNINAKTNNNLNKIDDLNRRVKDLERTQYVIEPEVRLADTRKTSLSTFVRYNVGRRKLDTVGIRFTYKIGTSYEERKLLELEQKLQQLSYQ